MRRFPTGFNGVGFDTDSHHYASAGRPLIFWPAAGFCPPLILFPSVLDTAHYPPIEVFQKLARPEMDATAPR